MLYCITRRRTMRVSVFGVPTRPVPPPPTSPEQPVLRTRLCNLSRVHRRFRFDVFFTAHRFNVLLRPNVRTHAYLFFLNSSCARVCRRGIKPFWMMSSKINSILLLSHYVLGVETIFIRAFACREHPIFLCFEIRHNNLRNAL